MNKIISCLKAKMENGHFFRNVLVMLFGTALGQLSSLLLSPILTRIYAPDLFGVLGFFTAIVTIFSVVATLRYDMALPLAQDQKESANLLGVNTICLFATTICFFLVVFILPSDFFSDLEPYRHLLPIGFFCIGAYQAMLAYATWHGSFKIISRTKIYQGVSSPVTQIMLGLAGTGTWGLIIGFIIGQSAGFGSMVLRLVIKSGDVIKHITAADMKLLAKRYIQFPLYSTWSSLVSVLSSSSLLMVMIPILYSPRIAGFIFLTDRIIGRPLLVISTSILQVYIGEAAKNRNSDPRAMRSRFLQVLKTQFAIVAFWLAIVNSTAFYLVPIIFGKDWAEAVTYIHILSIAFLMQMTMVAVANTLQILEKQALTSIWEFCRFLFISGGFVVSYIFDLEAHHSILIYSVTQAVMQLVLLLMMYHQIQLRQPKE